MPEGKENIKRGIAADFIREYTLWAVVKRLAAYIRPYSGMAVMAILFSLASSFFLVVRPYLIKTVIDNYLSTGNLDGFDLFMGLFAVVFLLRLVVGYFLSMLTGMIGQHVMHDLRMDIFSHMLSMEMSFFDHNRVGRLMTRITDDVNSLNELYTSGAIRMINNSTILIGIIAIMFVMDWKLALITMAVIPLLYGTGYTFAKYVRALYSNIRKWTARINAFLQESIQGIRIIQLMRRGTWSFGKFSHYSDELMNSKIRNVLYYGMFFPVMELIGVIGIVIVLAISYPGYIQYRHPHHPGHAAKKVNAGSHRRPDTVKLAESRHVRQLATPPEKPDSGSRYITASPPRRIYRMLPEDCFRTSHQVPEYLASRTCGQKVSNGFIWNIMGRSTPGGECVFMSG